MLLQLTDFSTEPLYRQISRQLAERIRRGELKGRLEPAHCLARGQRVSVRTVERAYSELVDDGWVESTEDSTFIVPNKRKHPSQKTKNANFNNWAELVDLDLAQKIQKSLLPPRVLKDDNVCITAVSESCDVVGGDMYDYFSIDNSRYGLVIGDACGHSFPAAMLISQIQAIIKSEVKNGSTLLDTMKFINSHIRTAFLKGKFVTLFYGIFDSRLGQLTYINAGHNFPFFIRQNGSHEFLTCSSPALGLMDNIKFNIGIIELKYGDQLFLYTDGITEAMNNNREEFGEERLLDIVRTHIEFPPEELVEKIQNVVSQHDTNINTDDKTIMIFQVNANTQKMTRCA